MSPMCRFAYTEDEINTDEFVQYIQNHRYASSKAELYKLELKTWQLDDVIGLEGIWGWTPAYDLENNGFEFVADIDLMDLFGIEHKPYQSLHYKLAEKKDEIRKRLEEINYSNQRLLIFRTLREGLNNWDSIEIFSVGDYHRKKGEIRKKLTEYWIKEQEKNKQAIKRRLAENEAKGIKLVDWETAKKRFEEYIKEKNPKNFLFDPSTNTGYDMESIEGRKRLYQDITKKDKKKS